jgi:transposase-like protein
MERRKFTREFKLETVRLIKDRGVSYVQAAQDLDVHQSQLRNWVRAFAGDPQQAFPGLRSAGRGPPARSARAWEANRVPNGRPARRVSSPPEWSSHPASHHSDLACLWRQKRVSIPRVPHSNWW